MNQPIFNTNAAFWTMCLGTFLAIQLVAAYFSRRIVTQQGNELQKEIKLKLSDSHEEKTCKAALEVLGSELVSRGNASLELVARFTEYHYIAIVSALASGTLGGIAAFLISSYSWNHSNTALQGFFVGCAGSLSFWLTAIQVFKYQETIAKHEAIYSACANLLSELTLAVYAPPEKDDQGNTFQLREFIQRIAKKVENLRSIGIAFDGSKIGFSKIETPR